MHYAFLETFSFDSMQPLNIDSKAILGNLDFIQNIENMDKNHIPSQSCLVVGFNFTASSFNHSEATNRNDLPSIENPYILFIGDSNTIHNSFTLRKLKLNYSNLAPKEVFTGSV